MPEISGDNRKRIPDHIRARYDRDCERLAEEVLRYTTKAAPASPLPGGGWHTNFDDAPKDGRWIVTIDKWRNAETMRWSNEVSQLFPEQGERGWVAKGGYSPNTRPELSVAWALIPAAPTGEPK